MSRLPARPRVRTGVAGGDLLLLDDPPPEALEDGSPAWRQRFTGTVGSLRRRDRSVIGPDAKELAQQLDRLVVAAEPLVHEAPSVRVKRPHLSRP
jgi:hypothetical protein